MRIRIHNTGVITLYRGIICSKYVIARIWSSGFSFNGKLSVERFFKTFFRKTNQNLFFIKMPAALTFRPSLCLPAPCLQYHTLSGRGAPPGPGTGVVDRLTAPPRHSGPFYYDLSNNSFINTKPPLLMSRIWIPEFSILMRIPYIAACGGSVVPVAQHCHQTSGAEVAGSNLPQWS